MIEIFVKNLWTVYIFDIKLFRTHLPVLVHWLASLLQIGGPILAAWYLSFATRQGLPIFEKSLSFSSIYLYIKKNCISYIKYTRIARYLVTFGFGRFKSTELGSKLEYIS